MPAKLLGIFRVLPPPPVHHCYLSLACPTVTCAYYTLEVELKAGRITFCVLVLVYGWIAFTEYSRTRTRTILRYKRKLKNFAPMMPVIKSVYKSVYHQIRLFAGKSDLYSVSMIILRLTESVQQVYCLNIWDIRYGKVLKLCFKEHGGYRV